MKKRLLIKLLSLLLVLILIGIKKQSLKIEIITKIEKNSNSILTITYPKTNIKKIDKKIENYINDTYDVFKNNTNYSVIKELNIDYKYKVIDNKYLNIILYTFINNNLDKNKTELTKEFMFNIKSKKIVKEKKKKISDINKYVIDPKEKVIALTFDDGPSKYTNKIIDILNENQSNATFFIVGNKANEYKDTLIKMIKSGNEIGNHSYNHKLMSHMDKDELKKQIDLTQEIIKNITGTYPRCLRPTYGSLNKAIKNYTDLKITLWNIDPKDWKKISSKRIADRVLNKAKDGSIILMHDIYYRSMEAVKIIVPELKSQGYQLITVSQLEEVIAIRDKIGYN